jgi:signal transduction histidine kinase
MSALANEPARTSDFRPWRHLPLVGVVALAYAAEVLFQPEVFSSFTPAAIAESVLWGFAESFAAGLPIALAVTAIEWRAARGAPLYTLQIVAGVLLASALGIGTWGLFVFRQNFPEALPYLAGQSARFTVIGILLALVDGFRRRAHQAVSLTRELAAAQSATAAQIELTQLRLLEAQVEPHFLFNTIATLRRTWHVDRGLGARMHANVIAYLSATLPQMRAPLGTLGEEFELSRAYLELFAVRMGGRLRFTLDLPDRLASVPFPRMIVLTLVENAIKHGLAPAADGGSICVRADTEGSRLFVRVSDDGVGFGMANTGGTGIGLVNVRARLRTQFGKDARLEIGPGERAGVEAVVRLPLCADASLAAGLPKAPEPDAGGAAVSPVAFRGGALCS